MSGCWSCVVEHLVGGGMAGGRLHCCKGLGKLIKMPALASAWKPFFSALSCVRTIAFALLLTWPLFALGTPSCLSLLLSLSPWPAGVMEVLSLRSHVPRDQGHVPRVYQ
jgi:hypothetical protein